MSTDCDPQPPNKKPRIQPDLIKIVDDREDQTIDRCLKRELENPKFSDLIVIVGPEEEEFQLHQLYMCGNSPFFKAALQNCWKEGEEGKVKLPEIDPEAFEAIVGWCYHRSLEINLETPDHDLQRMLDILSAADYLQIEGLEPAILKGLAGAIKQGKRLTKNRPGWITFMNRLCLKRDITSEDELVACASAIIANGTFYVKVP